MTLASLALFFGASQARAITLYTWDPDGNAGAPPSPTSGGWTGNLSGTWESSVWSTSQTGSSGETSWVDGNEAQFAVDSDAVTPPFTVTMNSNHSIGGIFIGPKTPDPCYVTILGPGQMSITGAQGFDVTSDAGDPGTLILSNTVTGTGIFVPEGNGQIYLCGSNTFTGGTMLGFSGVPAWSGTLGFGSNYAFGTGPIYLTSYGSGGTLAAVSNGIYTITNSVYLSNITLNIQGSTGGVKFSGPWSTGNLAPCTLNFIGATNIVTVSGAITNTEGFIKIGPGLLVLSGNNNTYGNHMVTEVATGALVAANTSGSATGSSAVNVTNWPSPVGTGLLTGSGIISGPVTNFSAYISATNLSGGTATLTVGPLVWQSGSAYQWAINNATGTTGSSSGWDELVVNGGMTNFAAPLTIDIISLTSANLAGPLSSFNNAQDYSWQVLHSTSPIIGFSTNAVVVSATGFSNSIGGSVAFSVSTNNIGTSGDMFVNFVHLPVLSLGNLSVGQNSNAVFNGSNTVPNSIAATAVYSWTSNGVAMVNGGRVSGANTPVLTITGAQVSDEATYAVTVVNAAGSASASSVLTVIPSQSVINWGAPSAITYGTALSSAQLDATANVPGTFVYSPALGAVPNAGTAILTVVFTPSNNVYGNATNTVNLVVMQEPLTVTASNFTRLYGQNNPAFTGSIIGLVNNDNISASYYCSATTSSPVGAYPIIPSLVDPNNRSSNYSVTLIDGTLDVGAVVSWPAPASIVYGTALGSNQLDATANVAGTFVYTPPLGTVLYTGTNTLSVTFTPTDNVDYNQATSNVTIVVTPATLTVTGNSEIRQYGDPNPVFTGVIVGVTNNDNITASYSCSATSSSSAGTYSIIPTLVDPNDLETNYTVSLINGTLTITAPPPPITAAAPNLIPLPVTLQQRAGIFTLCPTQPGTPVPGPALMQILADASSIQTAQYLAAQIYKSTGYQFQIATSTSTNAVKGAIMITTSNAIGTLGAEGYELTVAPDSVFIRAPQQGGAFYGVQSLLQLLPPQIYSPTIVTNVHWVAPCVYIEDYPAFSWRGAMVDVARHFIDKQGIKQIIDALAIHKLNTLHLHLVDDQGWRLQITNYPNLTTTGAFRVDTDYGLSERASPASIVPGVIYGGYYTQADAREMVAYAAQRHINIVPEIEMPAHSDAGLLSYPQFSCGESSNSYTMDYYGIQGIYDIDIYSLGRPGTMAYLEDVLTEVMGVFPSKYIHCGGDEVTGSGAPLWNSYEPDITNMQANGITPNNGTTSEIQYQNWFSRTLSTFLASNGRTMIGWSETEADGVVPGETEMEWQYGSSSYFTNVAEAGQQVVMTPENSCYVNYVEGTGSSALQYEPPFVVGGAPNYLSLAQVYAFSPVPSGFPSQYASNIIGAQCSMFCEYVPSLRNVMFKMWPRETAMSEVTWTPQGQQSFSSFTNRLVTEKQRYNAMGLNYDNETLPAIGSWSSVPTSGETIYINITTNITAAGEVDVNFWYGSGSNPLTVTSVSLYVNGVQVDIDSHVGTVESSATYQATEPFIPVYTVYVLHLPELVPGATYTIQATVAGSGGNSNSGTIYLANWN